MHVALDSVGVTLDGIEIIRDLTADFPSREITALVGPSGSGKTTTLALIAGTLSPTRGRVVITRGTRSFAPCERFVAWVPQGGQMLPGRTVIDNVLIGPLSEGWRDAEALVRASRALMLVGIETLQHQMARSLSGGEAQRLAFARAIATSRPILLADEPTANLDRRNAQQVLDVLSELRTERTVVVATHDLAIARAAANVVDLIGVKIYG